MTINPLVDMVCEIAGKRLKKRHDFTRPQGVRGRNSDNRLIREKLGWAPSMSLREGLARTCAWIEEEVKRWLVQEVESAEESM